MSWMQFSKMFDEGASSELGMVDDWEAAIDGNPNTPQDALKVAILNAIVDTKQMANLEQLCKLVIDLAREAIEGAEYGNQIVACRRELMQMPANTPYLSDALVALGYDEDGF